MLQKIRFWLLVVLVFTAPMSLHPSFAMPVFDFPSFRIGLYQLLAVFFVALCLPLIWKNRQIFARKSVILIASALAAALTWGVATSLVLPRTLLYSASLISLIFLGVSSYLTYGEQTSGQREQFVKTALWSGLVFGGLAIGELLLVTLSVLPPSVLCAGCTSGVFGFPRINLTAAEPQFLASSLLPALFAAVAFWKKIKPRWLTLLALLVTSVAISITFSRGAYLAIAVALAAYLLVLLVKRQQEALRRVWRPIVLSVAGFLTGWLLLVGSASYIYAGTPDITYNTTVSALSHLTLGLVNIPEIHPPTPDSPTAPTNPSAPQTNFDPEGFVEASSGDRLSAGQLALTAWSNTPMSLLVGVGMGNLGAYVQQHIVQDSPRDLTVYIFYILVLSELGLVGLTMLLAMLALPLVRSVKQIEKPWRVLALTLTLAFAVQFCFFGSYINIMYIPVWLGIAFSLLAPKQS